MNNVNLIRVTVKPDNNFLFIDIDKIVDISQSPNSWGTSIITALDPGFNSNFTGILVERSITSFAADLIDRGFMVLTHLINSDHESRLMLFNLRHMLMIGRCTCGRTKINNEYHVAEPLGYVLDKFNIINPSEVENLGGCDEN